LFFIGGRDAPFPARKIGRFPDPPTVKPLPKSVLRRNGNQWVAAGNYRGGGWGLSSHQVATARPWGDANRFNPAP
jgi:hypothetical protein